MINVDRQLDLFKLIGSSLEEKAEAYVIGGSAMMLLGSKLETKDIGLVFANKKDFEIIRDVLLDLDFNLKKNIVISRKDYEPKNKPIFLERGDIRIDMFLKEVICIKITQDIIDRVKEVHTFNNFIVNVVSPEDIILLKSATERVGDRLDAVEILRKYDVDWDIIINESINQTRIGEHVFPVFLFDFLEDLKEDLKFDIPQSVLNKIRKIAEDEMIKHIKR